MNTTVKNKKKKILIIGADGYIGTALSSYLKRKKLNITTLDTGYFRDGYMSEVKKSDLNIDIRKFKLSELKKYSTVIFLAAIQNDPSGIISSSTFYNISKKYTIKIAKQCKKYNIKFIFPSSCSVYGYGNKIFNENSKTFPLTNYSRNKIQIERELSKLSNKKFSPIALRFSTIFGYSPRIRLDLVINMLCMLAITRQKIVLNSNGLAWRPHLSIKDVCRAFYFCINSEINNNKLNIFNVGHNCNNLQIIKVAKLISKLTGSKITNNLSINNSYIKDKNVKKGIDKRSYKVDFTKFNKIFPEFSKKKKIENEIKDLVNTFKKLKVNEKDFNNYKFYRLQKMDFLLKNKKLNNKLFWVNKKK